MVIQLQGLLDTFRWVDLIDIVLVGFILYYLYKSIKNTRALSLLKGLMVLGLVSLMSRILDLHAVNWIIQQSLTVIIVALPVVFQPELRRALEKLGRSRFFMKSVELADQELHMVVDEVLRASQNMSQDKIGALIVFEREVGLEDYIDTGVAVDAMVSRELIENIFVPNTPLHDGALIIRGNRIKAAGCLLPLTGERNLSTELGTRHRAAIGLSEQTDAVILVVSEETGKISYAYGGHLYRHVAREQMHDVLMSFLGRPNRSISRFWKRGEGR